MNKQELKNALYNKTQCGIQHDGWCCGTCFFAINEKLTNRDWQTLLLFRGDYQESHLDNLPTSEEERTEILERIYSYCKR